jgi:methionine-S-sulfoxide reductase
MSNTPDSPYRDIYLAGGCFWGVEKYLDLIPGVVATEVGYANGKTENPTYYQVCHEHTEHAEAVKVTYDPNQITLPFLLNQYYQVIDPTSIDKQGNDEGMQYRTGIYYVDESDLPIIKNSIAALQTRYRKPIAIEVKPLTNYTTAETYHQKYLDKNPGGYCHIGRSAFRAASKAVDPTFAQPRNFLQ